MNDEIKLVTRGDDLGSAKTANKAIMDAYKDGILKNTSVYITIHQNFNKIK